jgi:hypothetical protein
VHKDCTIQKFTLSATCIRLGKGWVLSLNGCF